MKKAIYLYAIGTIYLFSMPMLTILKRIKHEFMLSELFLSVWMCVHIMLSSTVLR